MRSISSSGGTFRFAARVISAIASSQELRSAEAGSPGGSTSTAVKAGWTTTDPLSTAVCAGSLHSTDGERPVPGTRADSPDLGTVGPWPPLEHDDVLDRREIPRGRTD